MVNAPVEMARDPLHFDEDGYPTDLALKLIEEWDDKDPNGWFEFIRTVWYQRQFGWHVQDGSTDHWSGWQLPCKRYFLSTVGWSGNELIIRTMQKNEWLWDEVWQESKRGGHYMFEVASTDDIPTEGDDE